MEIAALEQLACLCLEECESSEQETKWMVELDRQQSQLERGMPLLDSVKHIGENSENASSELEDKFHDAIRRKNVDLVCGTGKIMEQIYQHYPDVRESFGVAHKVSIHRQVSDAMTAVQARSYFITMVDPDVHLKRNTVIQAVVRIKEADGNYYFHPALLCTTNGCQTYTQTYSAEMCFYAQGLYGDFGARHGIIAKDCTEATIWLQSPLRDFIPGLVGAQLKNQLVQDCYHVMVEFATWSRSIIESVAAQKQARELEYKNHESETETERGHGRRRDELPPPDLITPETEDEIKESAAATVREMAQYTAKVKY